MIITKFLYFLSTVIFASQGVRYGTVRDFHALRESRKTHPLASEDGQL